MATIINIQDSPSYHSSTNLSHIVTHHSLDDPYFRHHFYDDRCSEYFKHRKSPTNESEDITKAERCTISIIDDEDFLPANTTLHDLYTLEALETGVAHHPPSGIMRKHSMRFAIWIFFCLLVGLVLWHEGEAGWLVKEVVMLLALDFTAFLGERRKEAVCGGWRGWVAERVCRKKLL